MRALAILAIIMFYTSGPLDPFNFFHKLPPGPHPKTSRTTYAEKTYLWQTESQGASSLHSEWTDSPNVLYDTAASVQGASFSINSPSATHTHNYRLICFSDEETDLPTAVGQYLNFMWCDMSALKGKTIVSASLCVQTYRGLLSVPSRGFIVVLDNVAGDTAWLTGSQGVSGDNNRKNDPCWNYYSATEGSTAWAPSLDSRTLWSDYGIVSGPFMPLEFSGPLIFDPQTFDVTAAVQAYADDPAMANNGFIILGNANFAQFYYRFGVGAAADEQPFLKVVAK